MLVMASLTDEPSWLHRLKIDMTISSGMEWFGHGTLGLPSMTRNKVFCIMFFNYFSQIDGLAFC